MTHFIGDIQHVVTFVSKLFFHSNVMFELLLTHDYMEYCCNNDYGKRLSNSYKGLLKYIRLFVIDKISVLFIIKETKIFFYVKNII